MSKCHGKEEFLDGIGSLNSVDRTLNKITIMLKGKRPQFDESILWLDGLGDISTIGELQHGNDAFIKQGPLILLI